MIDSAELQKIDKLIANYCSPEWQDILFESANILHYRTGELIFKEGQKADNLYMVKEGKVKVFSSYTKKIEVIVRFCSDGEVIGHRGIGANFTFSVSGQALTDCTVYVFPMDVFRNVLMANNVFCYYFMLFYAEELRRSEGMRKNMLNMSVKQRVGLAIQVNMEAFGFSESSPSLLAFTLSKRDMASLANTTYESTIRSLGELIDAKLISIKGKQLSILDREGLSRFIFGVKKNHP